MQTEDHQGHHKWLNLFFFRGTITLDSLAVIFPTLQL